MGREVLHLGINTVPDESGLKWHFPIMGTAPIRRAKIAFLAVANMFMSGELSCSDKREES